MTFIKQIKKVINYKLKFSGKKNTDLNYLVHTKFQKVKTIDDKIKFIKYFTENFFLFSLIDIYHENNIANNGVVILKKNENL